MEFFTARKAVPGPLEIKHLPMDVGKNHGARGEPMAVRSQRLEEISLRHSLPPLAAGRISGQVSQT
jgi:hypothetical protein